MLHEHKVQQEPASPAIAIYKRMDGLEKDVEKRRLFHRMASARAKPC